MKKMLFVLFAIAAMAGTTAEAKSVSKTPVGCWSYKEESKPKTGRSTKGTRDTLLTYYRTDFDSIVLCKDGSGMLEYRINKQYVLTTEDGFEKVIDEVDEYIILFKWKCKRDEVQILSYYPNVSCTHVDRTADNRGSKYPSHFKNTTDEKAVQFMIDKLPELQFFYNQNSGRLFSNGYKAYFQHCKGKPEIPTSKQTII